MSNSSVKLDLGLRITEIKLFMFWCGLILFFVFGKILLSNVLVTARFPVFDYPGFRKMDIPEL